MIIKDVNYLNNDLINYIKKIKIIFIQKYFIHIIFCGDNHTLLLSFLLSFLLLFIIYYF